MDDGLNQYLRPTAFLDFDNPGVRDFAERTAGDGSQRDRAIRLNLAVRDGVRYDPYSFRLDPARYTASACLSAGRGFCVPKAILLAAAARAIGVPSRLGYADVRNHLTSPRLAAMMRSDVFRWHGYAALHIDGKWVKATPAFDKGLCTRFGVPPLEFDGWSDSILHEFDGSGRRHMEYLRYIGEFDDFPYARFAQDMGEHYSHLLLELDARDRRAAAAADPDFAA